ncbi:MAG: helix-turn-helix transcriptional regulator [bacterium]|nr:helix-turn-helix transcriptional regulator [bacterium]
MAEESSARRAFTQELLKAREYQLVALDQVAGETHIALIYLEALESGEWERIPGPYLRGYLTAYAECIGMVREKVLKRFDELGYLPPPPAQRSAADEAPIPTPIRIPLPAARRPPEELDSPRPAASGRPAAVPSFWSAMPMRHKVALGSLLLLLAAALVWGASLLVFRLTPADAPDILPAVTAPLEEEGPATSFLVSLETVRPARLRVLASAGPVFHGLCPADSLIQFHSATEVIVEVDALEHLRLWRDGRPLDLSDQPGPAELRLSAASVKIVRRSP